MVAVRLCPLLVSVSRLWCLAWCSRSLCPGLRYGIRGLDVAPDCGLWGIDRGGGVFFSLEMKLAALRHSFPRKKIPHHPVLADHGGSAGLKNCLVEILRADGFR